MKTTRLTIEELDRYFELDEKVKNVIEEIAPYISRPIDAISNFNYACINSGIAGEITLMIIIKY